MHRIIMFRKGNAFSLLADYIANSKGNKIKRTLKREDLMILHVHKMVIGEQRGFASNLEAITRKL